MSTINPKSGRAHLMYVSENLASMLGAEPYQLLGQSPDVLFIDSTPTPQLEAVAQLVDQGQQAVVQLDLAHFDGSSVPVQASFLSIPSHADGWPYFLALYRDLSVRPSPEKLLADQADVLDSLARGHDLPELLQIVASRVKLQVPSAECWISVSDSRGAESVHVSGDHPADLVAEVADYLTQSGDSSTHRCVRVEDLPGSARANLIDRGINALWIFPVAGPNRKRRATLTVAHPERLQPHPSERHSIEHLARVVAVAVERSETEASLAHQALHDPLTQLPNRALIVDRLEQAVARLGRDQTKLAALLVDIDRFKEINDVHGADVGDEVLLEVSRRLRAMVRLGDTVGRIGGDQFLVLCVAMNDEADAASMADRVIDALTSAVDVGNGTLLQVSASIGVVLIDRPGGSPAAIISNAESALDRAIKNGRAGYAMFEEGLQRRVVVRHEVEQALQVAITEDELVVHYQPLVDIQTGMMIGAEALIRWDRPGHGLLPPGDFIDIAEETGIIIQLGAWVIDKVCANINTWPLRNGSVGPMITVNLSARQLSDPSLVSTIITSMDRHAVNARNIGFEVTESMGVEDLEQASLALRRLAALGCKLAIDDFGIGYATLDYLRRFSMAETIKIDRSFVSGLGTLAKTPPSSRRR
ncbi:MAG: EAL domain-containing protein [Acidimicrobiales bacterium]